MLLQRLGEYADRELDLPPAMYQEQPIRYVIDLDREGRMDGGLLDTSDPSNRATRDGKRRLAPHRKKGGGTKPTLLIGTAEYVLGLPATNDDEERASRLAERARERHEAFVVLVESCRLATNEPAVQAVASFLDRLPAEMPPLPDDFASGANLTFRVGEMFPIDLPTVRSFWAGVRGAADEDGEPADKVERLPCVVCGRTRPVMARHPIKIKGIPEGQKSGTDLISANERAYESYGLKNSLIAPTCATCAEKYGNALNALLSREANHLRVGGAVYAFWTAAATGFQPGRTLSDPDPEEVRELIDAARSGKAAALDLEPTAFYAVGLSASGARVVVRAWIDTTVGEAKRRLGRWFALQEVVAWDGSAGEPFSVWRLAKATERTGGKDAPRAEVVDALMASALGGTTLPLDLLYQAVRRCRAEQGVRQERAALIKMVLGSRGLMEGEGAMAELELANREPAYLCGRLLAILDAIQQRALGNPNATIVDRYYGTASSAPALVFGTLLHGSRAHLGKLRKDQRTRGAYEALEQRLEEVAEPLAGFPKTLTLQEQGLFALGFYHQRAADRRARRERAESRDREAPASEDADGDAAA